MIFQIRLVDLVTLRQDMVHYRLIIFKADFIHISIPVKLHYLTRGQIFMSLTFSV